MRDIFKLRATLSLLALLALIYVYHGPAIDIPSGAVAHLVGVFQHGSLAHIAANCAVIFAGGWLCEPRLGSLRTAGLMILFALIGVLAELSLVGPGFIGASGVAYGLGAYGVIASVGPERRAAHAGLIGLALALDLMLRDNIAIYAHIVPSVMGGALAMLSSFLGSRTPRLKPMGWDHILPALAIIAQTDEDDAAEAEQVLVARGFDNMFVLMERREVLGMTGYSVEEETPDLAWLSWTYLDEAARGRGLGEMMMTEMIAKLRAAGTRKLFIETSDYAEEGVPIYAAAHGMYEAMGAKLELKVPDYHAPGEAKLVYGMDLSEAAPEAAAKSDLGLVVTGIAPAPEAEGVAALLWTAEGHEVSGLEAQCEAARRDGNRCAILAIPGDVAAAQSSAFFAAGFKKVGCLRDYYSIGSHQDWLSVQL